MIEKELVRKLIENNETISSMESCTAGYFATTITNVEGSSKVFSFSAITYSDDYKIRLGVNKEIIKKYGVYSFETSRKTARKISYFSESTYGVGITGKLKNMIEGKSEVFVSIYSKKDASYVDLRFKFINKNRLKSKQLIVKKIILRLSELLNK